MKCEFCGAEVQMGTRFCAKCGSPVIERRVEKKSGGKKTALIAMGATVAVLMTFVLGGTAGYMISSQAKDTSVRTEAVDHTSEVSEDIVGSAEIKTVNEKAAESRETYTEDIETQQVSEENSQEEKAVAETREAKPSANADSVILSAIDNYVPDYFNQLAISTGERTKPQAAIWCNGAPCKTYSSDENVVTINEAGVVTGIAPGDAYVVIEAMGSMTECYYVTVR